MSGIQREVQETLGVEVNFDADREVERRVQFLVDYATHVNGNRGFVLGVSGGQDSSLAARLAQLAVERLRSEGNDAQFLAVRLPYGTQHDEDDAQRALEFIQPDRVITLNIASAVDSLVQEVSSSSHEPVSDFNKGNIKARMRMVAQYALAGDRSMLVLGTDHAAEAVTGFFTKFGDGAADVLPLAGLTKHQGALMLQRLGAPDRLWQKVPTADLLDGEPGQTDEANLGVSYVVIDEYLMGQSVAEEDAQRIEHLYRRTEHKRRPPVTPADEWWK